MRWHTSQCVSCTVDRGVGGEGLWGEEVSMAAWMHAHSKLVHVLGTHNKTRPISVAVAVDPSQSELERTADTCVRGER
jgi:hypothetical protein